MRTVTQGNASEGAVLHALTMADIPVLVPFGDGHPFDLAAVAPEGVVRLQVKTGRVRNGCVEFNTISTDHGNGVRDYRGRADFIAVYVAELAQVFMVPVGDCPARRGYLRLAPPRNNQRRRVRLAEDYTFERWVERRGVALAAA